MSCLCFPWQNDENGVEAAYSTTLFDLSILISSALLLPPPSSPHLTSHSTRPPL